MLRRILIGIDNTRSSTAAIGLGILWAKRSGATLVGMAIVDEPGIRAIEPVWPVGGDPESDPVYYMGYEPRLAAVKEEAQRTIDQFAARCDEEGVAHTEVKRIGAPHEQIRTRRQTATSSSSRKGSQFRFIAGDDEGRPTLEEGLERRLPPRCRRAVAGPRGGPGFDRL